MVLEEFGGTVLSAEISAKKGTGIDHLLEQVLLQAEILDLKANPSGKGHGTVLEATLDPGRDRWRRFWCSGALWSGATTSSAASSPAGFARSTTNGGRR